PLSGRICKVLALDLDNTLWGGVIGEDGPTGIRLGVDYPGSAFQALQRTLKALTRRGVLLAVCSKNNEADALAVLEFMISPAALTGVRSFFPDPWPKARHHKRRLVQREVLALVGSRLERGGFWYLATDWQEYADAMVACFDADPRWYGGVIDRPEDRPITHYERRALREGREITDVRYTWSP
ncbi:MAG: HAD-IIIC family phosphatase, partial [bacterium]|nr:HAD-IIIC family phosphatase [bacterium]